MLHTQKTVRLSRKASHFDVLQSPGVIYSTGTFRSTPARTIAPQGESSRIKDGFLQDRSGRGEQFCGAGDGAPSQVPWQRAIGCRAVAAGRGR